MTDAAPISDGVFFLANDRVEHWVIPLLESFRAHNPDLPLMLIPYDERCDRLGELGSVYDYGLLSGPHLEAFDEIAERILVAGDDSAGMFRKLAAFGGPFQRFVYLDSDILVLDDLRPLLHLLDERRERVLFIHRTHPEYVFVAPERIASELGCTVPLSTFNAGAWASHHGTFGVEDLQALAKRAVPFRTAFGATNQPFFNFCIHASGVGAIDLSELDLAPRFLWAGDEVGSLRYRTAPRGLELSDRVTERRVALIHWAGYEANPSMPYRRIWTHYRLRRSSSIARLARWTDDLVRQAITRGRSLLNRAAKPLGRPHF